MEVEMLHGISVENFPQAFPKTKAWESVFEELNPTQPPVVSFETEPYVKVSSSLKETFERANGTESEILVQYICATMLIHHGYMRIDDPISHAYDYYVKSGHNGCSACPMVESCTACEMCK